MVAKQTRIERQETPACASVSFDVHAANAFQSYVQSALAFSIKRGGILYGTIDEEESGGGGGGVFVHAIYEPPQDGTPDSLVLHRGTEEEERADAVAAAFGWTKVGWIFTQSTKERDFICSAEEICQMAAIQSEMGEKAVTALVVMFPPEDEGAAPEVHFEAFQVSAQCVKLWEEGWFKIGKNGTTNTSSSSSSSEEPSATIPVQNPKDPADKSPIIVAGKDVSEVDADYFLVPVGIKDHEGPVGSTFPIENRFLPQGAAELKSHLQRTSARPYAERLSDFHLLLYIAKQPGLEVDDVAALVAAVANKEPVPEGYKIITESIAGM
jgi:nuclear protein localization protein 4 homolog